MKSLVLLASLLSLTVAARATVTETVSKTFPLNPDGAVHLDNVNGDIDIVAWDKAEVSVEAVKKARTDDDLHRVAIEFDSSPAKLTIKTKYEKTGWFHSSVNASVRYKLMVPAGAKLDKIDTVNSAITVTGVHGTVNLDTVNGTITARGLMADARLDSVNGSLEAEFASLEGVHDVKLDSVNGRAEVTLPKGANAEVKADTVNGRITVDQAIKLGKVGHRSLSGSIGNGAGPSIVLDTVNGGIAIRER
jgi:hypothetical protein